MNNKLALILLYLFTLTYAKCDSCENGVCTENQCFCFDFYEGANCNISWSSRSGWKEYFIVYVSYASIVNFILVVYSAYQLILIFWYTTNSETESRRWTIVTYILIGVFIATTIRFFYFSYDAHNYFKRFPTSAEAITFSLPLVIIIDVFFLQFLYWLELLNLSSTPITFVKKLKPAFVVITIITSVILFSFALLNSFLPLDIIINIFNGATGLFLIVLIVFSFISGTKFLRLLKELWKTSKQNHFRLFLRKVTFILLYTNAVLAFAVITIIFLIAFRDNPWAFITIHLVVRTEEFATVMGLLILVQKKKPEKSRESSKTTKKQSISANVDDKQAIDVALTNESEKEREGNN